MYFLQQLHKNLQRLASFALCIRNAPISRPINAVQLAENYKEYITKSIPIDQDQVDRVMKYITERAQVRKYAPKKDPNAEAVRRALLSGSMIESQDWFLSEADLPSSTGAEREQSYIQTVNACQEIGFLQAKTLILSSYGHLLKAVAQGNGLFNDEHKYLINNPFRPNIPFFIAAYFPILRNDMIFEKYLLFDIPDEFSFAEICMQMNKILGNIDKSIPTGITTRIIKNWIKKQLVASNKLKERINTIGWSEKDSKKEVAIQTLYRPFEDMLLPRLEYLVDIGVLRKNEPGHYNYSKNNGFNNLIKLLVSNNLLEGYFSTLAEIYGRNVRVVNKSEIMDHLLPGYKKFKNLAGYSPILETTVFANILSWRKEPWAIIEIADSFKILGEIARGNGSNIRINPDRYRQPFTFKIEGDK